MHMQQSDRSGNACTHSQDRRIHSDRPQRLVTVSKVIGDHAAAFAVRLAIEAPRDVDIVRTELLQRSEDPPVQVSR